MLKAQHIHKEYATRADPLVVLRDVSIFIEPGSSAVIMGPSGSGKSTLLNILGTLDEPTSGTLTLDGANPFDLPEADLANFRNRSVGFIFQDHHLLPQCNALENVLLPTLARRNADGNADRRAEELLQRVGLAERMQHLPSELSGGERQRVAVARALINKPALLLADEPTGNLDRRSAESIADLLVALPRDEGVILVVVTHSQQLARRFDRTYELDDGNLAPQS